MPAIPSFRKRLLIVLLFVGLVSPDPRHASAQGVTGHESGVPSEIRLGLTYLGVDQSRGHVAIEASYLGGTPRIWKPALIAGSSISTEGSFYGFAGLYVSLPLPLGIRAEPSLALGFYEEGRGVELGSQLEFRSGLLLRSSITGGIGIFAMVYHLSNAGIGESNPGMEAMGLGVTLPVFGPS